jgi:hypothetical protein
MRVQSLLNTDDRNETLKIKYKMKAVNFKNIATQSLSVSNIERTTCVVHLSRFENGLVSFSTFALAQFLLGCQLAKDYRDAYNHKQSVSSNVFVLLTLISTLIMETAAQGKDRSEEIFMTREEMVLLKSWLEARMEHCEKQRDDRVETFNADTYIGQKLLLLDIKELLLGEVVEC